jgi:hypothetical protein
MPSPRALDPFVAGGHPLHTRTLVVEARRGEEGRLCLDGVILDLRKCGFVPTGGDLQTAGFIHHMQLRLELDPATARIERLETAQPTVAFEPGPASAGDCCRDPAPRLQALVGERVDAGFARRLAAVFGGPLGCSHLLTLGQLVGASLPRFDGPHARLAERAPGERVAKRSLFLDGFEPPEGGLEVAIQLAEFHTTPAAGVTFPLERLAFQHELRLLARIDREVSRIESLDASERERSDATAEAAWKPLGDALGGLAGAPALRGLAQRVLAQLGDDAARAPLRDALLNLAPGVIQCLAALSQRMLGRFARGAPRGPLPRELSVGGYPDSWYMWRSDGPLARARLRAAAGGAG